MNSSEYRNFGYLQVSRRCINNCVFCSQPKFEYDMPLETAKKKVNLLKSKGVNEIILTGGEPTLNPSLPEIIAFIKKQGLDQRIITNGIKFSDKKLVKRLSEVGLNRVIISIHSHEKKENERLSSNPDSFEKILCGIDNVIAAGMHPSFNITLNALNCKNLSELCNFLIKRYPCVEHFVFNNLDIAGNARANTWIVARLVDLELELAKTLKLLSSNCKTFRVERVPLCYMAGYEEFSSETRRIVKGQMFRVYGREKNADFSKEVRDFHHKWGECCSACKVREICAGIDEGYSNLYGEGELYPLFGEPRVIMSKVTENKKGRYQENSEKINQVGWIDKVPLENQTVDAMVIEPVSACDIPCVFCNGTTGTELEFDTIARLIKENKSLEHPVKHIELGGSGNPLLHTRIKDILELVAQADNTVSIVTNGLQLIERISNISNETLSKVGFGIYLDGPDEKTNDFLMGRGVFKSTLNSFKYLTNMGAKFEVIMRVNPYNHKKIKEMTILCEEVGASCLLPIEIFPLSNNYGFQLSGMQKASVVKEINSSIRAQKPVFKVIHFEEPTANCTYIRKKRIFINCRGILAFCHFLSPLANSWLTDTKNKTFSELLRFNSEVRTSFIKKKEGEIKDWNPKRNCASPCSFCLYCHGKEEEW